MNTITVFSTSWSASHRLSDRELAATGVEFIFAGSYSLREPAKDNRNNMNGIGDLWVAGKQRNKRSGRYRSHAVPK